MVQYDRKILNHLLDTYENSLLSTGENKRTIQIEFRFTKKTIPAYFDESSTEYESIHFLMKSLEMKNLIRIVWKDNKQDYLIQKVRLMTDHLEEVYRYVGRKAKRGLEEENILFLQEYLDVEAPVTESFVRYLLKRLQNHQSVKEYISLENRKETERFLQACILLEQNRKPCYIREFSITHFQDSKYFEQIQNRIAKVFRQFSGEYAEMDVLELLAEYGIYHTPNYVYFKGDARMSIGEEMVELSLLKQGIGISGEDLTNIQFSDLRKIKKVITIENLTSFFQYKEKESLIIYLGGYHNRLRRTLLKMIYEVIPDAEYYHFGDIDAGGFCILKDLRKKTGIPFMCYHMDLDTLKRYMQYGKSLTGEDRKRLEKLQNEEEFREVIGFMLEKNIKLEQECIQIC
ncbi:MAG: Wadjet anti-phage system protein JetD domain-containing protein [Lachnospiraceae bacterium]